MATHSERRMDLIESEVADAIREQDLRSEIEELRARISGISPAISGVASALKLIGLALVAIAIRLWFPDLTF
jgi:hypothetical protein